MTTINNLTIEQMREIVEGAPTWAIWWCVEKKKFLDFIPCSKCLVIEDLCTAIAEHDQEFKVGDKYVMLKISHSELITVNEGDIEQPWWNTRIIRHATPSEIKAGHRIDDNTDHVTDIRNHVSPSTRVVDL